jgi:hypothetical protein
LPILPTCGECSLVGAGASGFLISTMIEVGPLVSGGGALEDWASLLQGGVAEASRICPSGLSLYLSRSAKNPPAPDVSFPSAVPLVPSTTVAPKSPLSLSFFRPDTPLQNKGNVSLRWPTRRLSKKKSWWFSKQKTKPISKGPPYIKTYLGSER